jgi:hypothetical protein
MRLTTTFVSCLALGVFVSAAWCAEIPQGVHLLLRMENSLSTRTAQQGDYVYLRSASPIAVDGQIIVPVGSYVQGVVVATKRSGRVSGRAELAIRLETLTLAQGKVVKFAPHLSSVDSGDSGQKVVGKENLVEQQSTHGQDAARIAILAGTGASIGGVAARSWSGAGIGGAAGSAVGLATVLLTRGKEVELKQGATLDVVFDRPIVIE